MDRREFLSFGGGAAIGLALSCASPGAAGPTSQTRRIYDAWLEIDHQAIAWNLKQIRTQVANRPVMAVIKANAYGHGLVETGKCLETQGIHSLAVGKLDEAVRLRTAGLTAGVLNLGPLARDGVDDIVRLGISQSVFTDDVAHLGQAARRLEREARVHVKVDTGLGRVGVPHDRALAFVEKVASTPGVKIEGIFTSFTEEEDFDRVQLRRFLEICEAARKKGIDTGLRHAASSAAILSFADAHLDLVRPGITIYGHYPSTGEAKKRRIDLRPAMSLKTRVGYVKNLHPGDSVSYHRAFVAMEETEVATLSIGYSDGYPHRVAQEAQVLIGGRRLPSIGLITSNHTTVRGAGDRRLRIGQVAVLIGAQGEERISADEVAAWAETSVYKILIGMSPLLPRSFQ